jgi:hypothetical protein
LSILRHGEEPLTDQAVGRSRGEVSGLRMGVVLVAGLLGQLEALVGRRWLEARGPLGVIVTALVEFAALQVDLPEVEAAEAAFLQLAVFEAALLDGGFAEVAVKEFHLFEVNFRKTRADQADVGELSAVDVGAVGQAVAEAAVDETAVLQLEMREVQPPQDHLLELFVFDTHFITSGETGLVEMAVELNQGGDFIHTFLSPDFERSLHSPND